MNIIFRKYNVKTWYFIINKKHYTSSKKIFGNVYLFTSLNSRNPLRLQKSIKINKSQRMRKKNTKRDFFPRLRVFRTEGLIWVESRKKVQTFRQFRRYTPTLQVLFPSVKFCRFGGFILGHDIEVKSRRCHHFSGSSPLVTVTELLINQRVNNEPITC